MKRFTVFFERVIYAANTSESAVICYSRSEPPVQFLLALVLIRSQNFFSMIGNAQSTRNLHEDDDDNYTFYGTSSATSSDWRTRAYKPPVSSTGNETAATS